jgi:phosphoribosyl 1,2-cyclic phosphate phosphodiesterase
LAEAIALSQQLGVEQTYFTHISHQLGLYTDVKNELPDGINLAFDTFSFVI